jgi:hypothetical protein
MTRPPFCAMAFAATRPVPEVVPVITKVFPASSGIAFKKSGKWTAGLFGFLYAKF